MRIWQDAQGNLITDEQLLRYVARHGSLLGALAKGDVRLISEGNKVSSVAPDQHPRRRQAHAKLSTLI